jgi:hypothetical protein
MGKEVSGSCQRLSSVPGSGGQEKDIAEIAGIA